MLLCAILHDFYLLLKKYCFLICLKSWN